MQVSSGFQLPTHCIEDCSPMYHPLKVVCLDGLRHCVMCACLSMGDPPAETLKFKVISRILKVHVQVHKTSQSSRRNKILTAFEFETSLHLCVYVCVCFRRPLFSCWAVCKTIGIWWPKPSCSSDINSLKLLLFFIVSLIGFFSWVFPIVCESCMCAYVLLFVSAFMSVCAYACFTRQGAVPRCRGLCWKGRAVSRACGNKPSSSPLSPTLSHSSHPVCVCLTPGDGEVGCSEHCCGKSHTHMCKGQQTLRKWSCVWF